MRARFQKGNLFIRGNAWVGPFYDAEGHHRKRVLGRVGKITKSEAQKALAAILVPINSRAVPTSQSCSLADFIGGIYLPFYRRKWKHSTKLTNEDRINHHIVTECGEETLGSFNRDGLQSFLDRKGATGLSFSVVDHLRWDLKQLFGMAVS